MGGAFITFEGCDGSGKSSQVIRVAQRLRELGVPCRVVREPGGVVPGDLGERIRELLLDPGHGAVDPIAELLLYEASRAQLMTHTIRPAIERGEVVLCDRHADSSVAYQGYGREAAPLAVIAELNAIATGGTSPDLTLLLDVDPTQGLEAATTGGADRLEREDIAFHQRVRAGFLAIAAAEPERVVVVHRASVDQVAEDVWSVVEPLLRRLGVLG